uniref:Uncharacterized protein n=1 Tax=Anopheles atroparvus TaxID=41427 RepID=A0A182JMJ8_ANOAO
MEQTQRRANGGTDSESPKEQLGLFWYLPVILLRCSCASGRRDCIAIIIFIIINIIIVVNVGMSSGTSKLSTSLDESQLSQVRECLASFTENSYAAVCSTVCSTTDAVEDEKNLGMEPKFIE